MTAPQRLTDRKREAIIQAAIAEFRAHGFEITSMDKIAATAGVSKRTVYNHFPSKEELFAEILNQLWARIIAEPSVSYDREQPLHEQLRLMLREKVQMMADENFLTLARVAIAATIHSPERAQNMIERMGEREEGLTVWIRAAQAADGSSRWIQNLPRIKYKVCSRHSRSGRRSRWVARPLIQTRRMQLPSRRWRCSWHCISGESPARRAVYN